MTKNLTNAQDSNPLNDQRTTVRFPNRTGSSFFQGWGPKA
jgi:hypothetical protein